MGSKTSVTQLENNDASQVQGLQAIRGDGNSVIVTDSDAVKNALQFAGRTADGQAQSIADVLGTVNNLAGKLIDNATTTSQDAIKGLMGATNNASASIAGAYQSATGTMKPENILLIVAALAAIIFLRK